MSPVALGGVMAVLMVVVVVMVVCAGGCSGLGLAVTPAFALQ